MCSRASGIASGILVTVALVGQVAVVNSTALLTLPMITSVASADSLAWNGHRASGMDVATAIAG
jgi:hypothetical protein